MVVREDALDDRNAGSARDDSTNIDTGVMTRLLCRTDGVWVALKVCEDFVECKLKMCLRACCRALLCSSYTYGVVHAAWNSAMLIAHRTSRRCLWSIETARLFLSYCHVWLGAWVVAVMCGCHV